MTRRIVFPQKKCQNKHTRGIDIPDFRIDSILR